MTNSTWSRALAHDVSLPQGFAVQCRFPGLDGTYHISSQADLYELAADPVAFAADLSGLSKNQYLRQLNHGGGK